MRAESREHICFWNQATEVSEPYIGGVLQAPYCTAIELWEKHKMSWIDTCGLFIFCNIIKQICHIQYTWYVHVFAQLLNKMFFFSMLKRLGIRNLEKTEEWVGRQHYCWPEKKLCCTLGNGFKSLLFSSDCKVNMERCKIQSKCEQIKTHHSHLLKWWKAINISWEVKSKSATHKIPVLVQIFNMNSVAVLEESYATWNIENMWFVDVKWKGVFKSTCIAGVRLGGQGGCVGHGCAEERWRVVDIDLEPVHVALVQVVDLRWIKGQCSPHKRWIPGHKGNISQASERWFFRLWAQIFSLVSVSAPTEPLPSG